MQWNGTGDQFKQQPPMQAMIGNNLKDKKAVGIDTNKPPRKYLFTKSTTVLAQQHSPSQFTQIINSKKTFQTMIKAQLNKLQSNVADPEIDPFIVPQDKNLRNKLISNDAHRKKQEFRNLAINAANQWEVFLDCKIDGNKLERLIKINRRKYGQILFKKLKENKAASKKLDAAAYFDYERVLKKYFSRLQSLMSSSTDIDGNQSKCLIKYLKKSELGVLLTCIRKRKTSKKEKQFLLNKSMQIKKNTIQFMLHQIGQIVDVKAYHKMKMHEIKSAAIGLIQMFIRERQRLENSKDMMKKVIKHRLFLIFADKCRILRLINQFKRKKTYSLQSKFLKLRQALDEIGQNQLTTSLKQQINQKLQQQNKINSTMQSIKSHQKKTFFKFLKSHALITKYQSNCQNSYHKRCSKFFINLKVATQTSINQAKIVWIMKMKYFGNFVHHATVDLKYKNSMMRCLKGSPEWLIKNKHIFKAEPLLTSRSNSVLSISSGPHEDSHTIAQFSHPMATTTLKELLVQESKFKKIWELQHKRWFLKQLSVNLMRNKKQTVVIQTCQLMRRHRTLKRVWQLLKNINLVRQIIREIGEEIEMAENQQIKSKSTTLKQMVKKFDLIGVYKRLHKNLESKNKIKQLSEYIFSKTSKLLLNKLMTLRIYKQQEEKTKKKCKSLQNIQRKHRFQKLKGLLTTNLHQNHKKQQIISKFTSPTNKQMSISQALNISLANKCKKQFFLLLRKHLHINKGSIGVTSLYLSGVFRKMESFRIWNSEFNDVLERQQYFQVRRSHQRVKECLQKWKIQRSFVEKIEHKRHQIEESMHQSRKNKLIKALISFSTGKMAIDFCTLSIRKLEKLILKNKKKIFLSKLHQIVRANKIKIQKQKKQKISDERLNNEMNNQKSESKIQKNESQLQQQSEHIQKNNFSQLFDDQNSNKKYNASKIYENNKAQSSGINQDSNRNIDSQVFSPSGHYVNESEDFQESAQNKSLHNQNHDDNNSQYNNQDQSGNKNENQPQNSQSRNPVDHSSDNKWQQYFSGQQEQVYSQDEQSEHYVSPYPRRQVAVSGISGGSGENDQLSSYEQFRKSVLQSKNKENIQQKQKKMEDSRNNNIDDDIRNVNSSAVHAHKDKYQEESEQQKNTSQILNSQLKQSQISGQSLDIDAAYLQNRYEINLLTRYFNTWKIHKEQQDLYEEEYQDKNTKEEKINNKNRKAGQSDRSILQKIMLGWRMYSTQKRQVRIYLQQYEQELHYYPHSKQQYQQFKSLSRQ